MNGWPTTFESPESGFFDQWTLSHLAVGAACQIIGFDWKSTLIVAIGWELLENLHIMPRSNWRDETFINTVGDVVTNMAGFWLTEKLR